MTGVCVASSANWTFAAFHPLHTLAALWRRRRLSPSPVPPDVTGSVVGPGGGGDKPGYLEWVFRKTKYENTAFPWSKVQRCPRPSTVDDRAPQTGWILLMRHGDPRAWMWAEACELLEQADRLQRRFFQLGGAASRPAWEPPVDVYETDETLWILVALPGVAPDQVKIVVADGTLIVTGDRPLPAEARIGVIHRVEIPHGRFERRIRLPAGRFELDGHALANGCLMLSLRKLL